MTTEVTADMAIQFKLFGSMHTIRFRDLGVASVDIYASLGGNDFVFFIMIVYKKTFRNKTHTILDNTIHCTVYT